MAVRTFNVPEEVENTTFEDQLNSLEDFWENEAPRVGEPFAKGWKNSRLATEAIEAFEAAKIGENDSSDPYEIWHYQEKESDRRLFMPTRTSNMNDDPYSTVLFTDVRPFLFSLRSTKGQDMFRLVWLSFMGLHIPGLSSSLSSSSIVSDDRWADTAFMQPNFLERLLSNKNIQRSVIADSLAGVTIGREKVYKSSFEAVKAWSLGVLEPLEGLTIDGRYRMWGKGLIAESDGSISNVIGSVTYYNGKKVFANSVSSFASRHILEHVRRESEDSGWDILGLAFEATKPDSRS